MRKERTQVFVNQSSLLLKKLERLDDVDLSGLEEGSFLIWNTTTSKWETTTELGTGSTANISLVGGTF